MSNQNENERALDKLNELRLIACTSFTVILFNHPTEEKEEKNSEKKEKSIANDNNGSSCELLSKRLDEIFVVD